ncbi:tetratricopeptide repeat protein [bacterium]|nr:tetratricopeptide repeat protein [bacterium]
MMRSCLVWFGAVLLLILLGCAASLSPYEEGRRSMAAGDYESALKYFDMALKESPDDPMVLKELGVLYHRREDYSKAIRCLLRPFLQDSTDGRTLFYLGTAYEARGDRVHAMDIYRRFTQVSRQDDVRKEIQARMEHLILKQMEEEARAILEHEEAIPVDKLADNAVAVLYFKNLGKRTDLDPMQKGLADMIITDLTQVKKIRVVERLRLQKMLDEIGLGQTGIIEDASAPRMGKLLGASKIVRGAYLDTGKDGLRIDAGVIRAVDRKIGKPKQFKGQLQKVFRLEKDVVFGVVDQMGIRLTQQEKDAINIIPTENLLAFLAYSRGLDYQDRGMYREAEQEFRKAVELDPTFEKAAEQISRVETLSLGNASIPDLEQQFVIAAAEIPVVAEPVTTAGAQPETAEAEEELPAVQAGTGPVRKTEDERREDRRSMAGPAGGGRQLSVIDRMERTGEVMTQVFLPGVESREPAQEQSQSGFGNSASFEINVPLP